MDKTARFKIDIRPGRFNCFGLFFRLRGIFWDSWDEVEAFDTQDKAREYYEKVKDLPEYLA